MKFRSICSHDGYKELLDIEINLIEFIPSFE